MNTPTSACVELTVDASIAGRKTRADWQALRGRLAQGEAHWDEAFNDFYRQRLESRYLRPIMAIQQLGALEGEGFAIAALQCTLIEFLESTEQGINYVHRKPDPTLFQYSRSGEIFKSFLTRRRPFSDCFDEEAATSFYEGIRCGLLHEARTHNGWRIWGRTALKGQIADVANKVVNRDSFQAALLQYIAEYGARLPKEPDLQAAFFRKFDVL
ncbi:MAG: hypothetical protein CFE46_13685 [Burkholderiales bacterium PBB6]|nr:MAG: hypothetical protein CFE46_13685 [Burkholderiales bacterium PBB6]